MKQLAIQVEVGSHIATFWIFPRGFDQFQKGYARGQIGVGIWLIREAREK